MHKKMAGICTGLMNTIQRASAKFIVVLVYMCVLTSHKFIQLYSDGKWVMKQIRCCVEARMPFSLDETIKHGKDACDFERLET